MISFGQPDSQFVADLGSAALSPFEELATSFMHEHSDRDISNLPMPPDTLYHYTNADGLFGILNTQRLWATSAPFMNDNSELSHSLELLKYLIRYAEPAEHNCGSPHEAADSIMVTVADAFLSLFEIYLVCFSTEPDLLSQWTGYGQDGGYSIGLSSTQLPERSSLRQVNYEPVSQASVLADLIRSWRHLFHSSPPPERKVLRSNLVAMCFALPLARLITQFKHRAFEAEHEWRLIIFRLPFLPAQPRREFRTRNGMLLPYVELPSHGNDEAETLLPVTDVRIGPRPYSNVAGYAIEQLLLDKGYAPRSVRISPSGVPLRT